MPLSFFRAFRRQDSHGKRTLLHRDLPPTKKPLVSHQMQPNAAGSATPSFAVRHNQVVKNCFHHTQTRPAMVRWCIGERMKEIMSRKGICSRLRFPQRVNRITRRHRNFSDCAYLLLQNIFRRFRNTPFAPFRYTADRAKPQRIFGVSRGNALRLLPLRRIRLFRGRLRLLRLVFSCSIHLLCISLGRALPEVRPLFILQRIRLLVNGASRVHEGGASATTSPSVSKNKPGVAARRLKAVAEPIRRAEKRAWFLSISGKTGCLFRHHPLRPLWSAGVRAKGKKPVLLSGLSCLVFHTRMEPARGFLCGGYFPTRGDLHAQRSKAGIRVSGAAGEAAQGSISRLRGAEDRSQLHSGFSRSARPVWIPMGGARVQALGERAASAESGLLYLPS